MNWLFGTRAAPTQAAPTPEATSGVEYVVLLADVSPSMLERDYRPTRLAAAQNAVVTFVATKQGIDPRDAVAVFGFDAHARLVLPFDGDRGALTSLMSALTRTGSGTGIGEALETARQYLRASAPPNVTRRIVILSDGGSNSGREPMTTVSSLRVDRVHVDAVGIGNPQSRDYRDGEQLLQALTSALGGTFVRCANVDELLAHYRTLARKVRPAIIRSR